MIAADLVAQTLFVGTQWIEVSNSLFVAKERLPSAFSKSAQAKWQKEIEQARILSERGHKVYLVPEKGTGRHYDALVNGRKTEMKTVTGNIGSVGKNFTRALKQGTDVFLRIKTPTNAKRVYSKRVGSAKVIIEKGVAIDQSSSVYIWLDEEERLRKWDTNEIFNVAKGTLREV